MPDSARARSPSAPLALRGCCDVPDVRLGPATRRNDGFAALAGTMRIDFGPVFSGEWIGRWRSRMPLARLFYVADSGLGAGSLSDGVSTLPLLPDTWAFLPPGREIVHDQRPGFRVVSVHFRISIRGRPNPFLGCRMHGGTDPAMRSAFLALAGASPDGGPSAAPSPGVAFAAQGAIWTLLGRVAEAEGPAMAANMERSAEFARLFEAIEAAPERDVSVAQMAAIVHMGESAFAKRFRAAMGDSPRAWFNARRARAAAEALFDDGATVSEVAARFGFGNEFYFSRFFKRHFGASPSAWRRQRRI